MAELPKIARLMGVIVPEKCSCCLEATANRVEIEQIIKAKYGTPNPTETMKETRKYRYEIPMCDDCAEVRKQLERRRNMGMMITFVLAICAIVVAGVLYGWGAVVVGVVGLLVLSFFLNAISALFTGLMHLVYPLPKQIGHLSRPYDRKTCGEPVTFLDYQALLDAHNGNSLLSSATLGLLRGKVKEEGEPLLPAEDGILYFNNLSYHQECLALNGTKTNAALNEPLATLSTGKITKDNVLPIIESIQAARVQSDLPQ